MVIATAGVGRIDRMSVSSILHFRETKLQSYLALRFKNNHEKSLNFNNSQPRSLTHGVRLFWARKTNGYELPNPCFYDQIGAFAKHSAVFGAERSRNVNVIAVTSKHQQSWPFWAQTREKSPPRYNSNICRKI